MNITKLTTLAVLMTASPKIPHSHTITYNLDFIDLYNLIIPQLNEFFYIALTCLSGCIFYLKKCKEGSFHLFQNLKKLKEKFK